MRYLLLACMLLAASSAYAIGPVLRSCTLTWGAPTTNADGTALTDLAKYNVYVAATSGVYSTPTAIVNSPKAAPAPGDTASWVCTGLTQGQHYAVVTAVDSASNESTRSNEVPFVIDVVPPNAPAGLSVGP